MADTTSPATGRRYGVARVCRVWEVARSSFYAVRQAGAADDAGARSGRTAPSPPRARRGVARSLPSPTRIC